MDIVHVGLAHSLAQIAGGIEFAAGRVQGVGQHDHIGLEALDPLVEHGAFFVQLQVMLALRGHGLQARSLLGQRRALRVRVERPVRPPVEWEARHHRPMAASNANQAQAERRYL
jgi:hypothetical protein